MIDIKTINSTKIQYQLNGDTEEIIVKDNLDNQNFTDIQMGDCVVSLPREIIYELRLVLSKYE